MQQGKNKEIWRIKWADRKKQWSDPLMGWTGASVFKN